MISDVLRKIGAVVLDMVQTVVMAGAVFVIMYLFVFQPNQVKGSSMVPTFIDGEYVLTDKITYRFVRPPEPGDVIVFKAPKDERFDFIKRIIAVPGQKIKISSGRVYVDGVLAEESPIEDETHTGSGMFLREGMEITLGEGEFFVLGDNRDHSSDSRDWGPVPEGNIVGRVWLRYWPPGRFGIINVNQEAQETSS
jgi:signal peptidase I